MKRPYKNAFSSRFGPGVCCLAFAIPACTSAAVISGNFGAGHSYGIAAGNPVGNAFDGNTYAEADTFKPSASGNLASITIALSCVAFCPAADSVAVALTADTGNRPGSVIESFNVMGSALGTIGKANPALVLNSALHPLLLVNTRYWITVAADLNDSIAWNVNSTGDMSDEAISSDAAATWFSPSGQTPGAFEVNATVPEPMSAALLLLGIIAIAAAGSLRSESGSEQPRP